MSIMVVTWYLPLLLLLISYTEGLNPIVTKGNKLVDAVTNERFYVRGLGYFMMGDDESIGNIELSNIDACREHVELIRGMGVNLLRLYKIDHTKNHDECMELLERENIYIALDLDSYYLFDARERRYDLTVLDQYKKIIDEFDKYDNVGFYILGYEMSFSLNDPDKLLFYKASIRDIKSYIKTKNHQTLVGYISSDYNKLQDNKIIDDYETCGKLEARPDFIGLNTYNWCQNYDEFSDNLNFAKEYDGYNLPIFMSDFACKRSYQQFPMKFHLLLNTMDSIFSGGIINGFGSDDDSVFQLNHQHRVINKNTALINEIKLTFNQHLQSHHHHKVDDPLNPTIPLTCPTLSPTWKLHSNLPPTPNEIECNCLLTKLECIADHHDSYSSYQLDEILTILKSTNYPIQSIISYNLTSGDYGLASTCSPQHRLSWLINYHYLQSGRTKEACPNPHKLQIPKIGKPETCFKDFHESNSSFTISPNSVSTLISVFSLFLLSITI